MTYGTARHRASERINTLLGGRIVSNDRSSSVECIVWDISDTGARIGFSQPAEIPLEFELEIPTEQASARVRLIWSNGKEHGVMFTD